MTWTTVETYDQNGNLIETQNVEVPDEPVSDPVGTSALDDAKAAIQSATTFEELQAAMLRFVEATSDSNAE